MPGDWGGVPSWQDQVRATGKVCEAQLPQHHHAPFSGHCYQHRLNNVREADTRREPPWGCHSTGWGPICGPRDVEGALPISLCPTVSQAHQSLLRGRSKAGEHPARLESSKPPCSHTGCSPCPRAPPAGQSGHVGCLPAPCLTLLECPGPATTAKASVTAVETSSRTGEEKRAVWP